MLLYVRLGLVRIERNGLDENALDEKALDENWAHENWTSNRNILSLIFLYYLVLLKHSIMNVDF